MFLRTSQDIFEIPFNCSADKSPAPGISLSITYFGIIKNLSGKKLEMLGLNRIIYSPIFRWLRVGKESSAFFESS
jgi:hypothetical protein